MRDQSPTRGATLPMLLDILAVKGYKVEYPLHRKDATARTVRLVAPDGRKQEFHGATLGMAIRLGATYVIKHWF